MVPLAARIYQNALSIQEVSTVVRDHDTAIQTVPDAKKLRQTGELCHIDQLELRLTKASDYGQCLEVQMEALVIMSIMKF